MLTFARHGLVLAFAGAVSFSASTGPAGAQENPLGVTLQVPVQLKQMLAEGGYLKCGVRRERTTRRSQPLKHGSAFPTVNGAKLSK